MDGLRNGVRDREGRKTMGLGKGRECVRSQVAVVVVVIKAKEVFGRRVSDIKLGKWCDDI